MVIEGCRYRKLILLTREVEQGCGGREDDSQIVVLAVIYAVPLNVQG
jgi:hypothetical protein